MIASPHHELNGLRVSRETSERLAHFASLFQKWAKSINLVAPSTISDMWQRHIADSAQIFQLCSGPKRWVDLGSGGGFPGIITAIFLAELSDGWVHLVESNKKGSLSARRFDRNWRSRFRSSDSNRRGTKVYPTLRRDFRPCAR